MNIQIIWFPLFTIFYEVNRIWERENSSNFQNYTTRLKFFLPKLTVRISDLFNKPFKFLGTMPRKNDNSVDKPVGDLK